MHRRKLPWLLATLFAISISAAAAEPNVSVRPLEGDGVVGRLMELTPGAIKLAVGEETVDLPTSKLMWIDLTATGSAPKPTMWLELMDGSRISAVTYEAREGTATVGLATGQSIQLPTRSVRSVRFHQQSPELARQWREITTSTASGDMLVTRKTSTRTIEQGDNEPRTVTEQALDQLEGTLLDVTRDAVRFEIDGEKVPIRREKLEGLVYYQASRRELQTPICRLNDAAGSQWLVRDIKLVGNRMNVVTPGNVSLELPVSMVAKLDFSVGNVALLTDLEPDSGAGEIPVSLQPAAMSFSFGRFFQLDKYPRLGSNDFRIAGQRFENGLTLHSPMKLVYRVPEGFRKFQAVAGVDDSLTASGRFNFVVLGDGKELVRQAFAEDMPRQALNLALNVTGIRRITILLEPADGQDFGDQLDLCEARFTK